MSKLRIRKTAALGWPWRVTCPVCTVQAFHLVAGVGLVVVNDPGVANGSFRSAMAAATAHIRAHVEGRLP